MKIKEWESLPPEEVVRRALLCLWNADKTMSAIENMDYLDDGLEALKKLEPTK